MPPAGKKGGTKSSKATSAKSVPSQAGAMRAWLTAPKKTGSAQKVEEPKEEEETKVEEMAVEEPVTQTRSGRRSSRSPPKAKRAAPIEPPAETSTPQMEGIEETVSAPMPEKEVEEPILGLESQIDDALERSKAKFDAAVSRRTRNAVYRAPDAIDDETAAILEKYGSKVDEEDELLKDILGTSPPGITRGKMTASRSSGLEPPKKLSKQGKSKEALLARAIMPTGSSKGNIIDNLIAKQKEEEEYSEKLATILQEITDKKDGTEMSAASATPIKAKRLSAITFQDVDDFHQETSFMMTYFSPSNIPVVQPQLKHVTIASPSASPPILPNTMAASENTVENQDTFNRFCSQPNAILKLPLLRLYLKNRICPPNVADWLLDIMCGSPNAEIALESYQTLLSLLPVPAAGWPSRINKCSRTPAPARNVNRNAFPTELTFFSVFENRLLNFFGSGVAPAIIKQDTVDSHLMEHSSFSKMAGKLGKYGSEAMLQQLEEEANTDTDAMASTTAAAIQLRLQSSHSNVLFRPYNFGLLMNFLAACIRSGVACEGLTQQQHISFLVSLYRSILDPNCQILQADIQLAILEWYGLMTRSISVEEFPMLMHYIVNALWDHLPAPQSMFHESIYMWVYHTPCSSPIMKTVRSSLAFALLQRQIDSMLNPTGAAWPAPVNGPAYTNAGTHLITLPQVTELVKSCKFPKEAEERNWKQYSSWVLLLDIALACFHVSDLVNNKCLLTAWDNAFGGWMKQAREKGEFDIQMTKFKDLATHAFTKIRVMSNSVIAPKKGPLDAFFAKPTSAPATPKGSKQRLEKCTNAQKLGS